MSVWQLVRTTLCFEMALEHETKPIGHILVGALLGVVYLLFGDQAKTMSAGN